MPDGVNAGQEGSKSFKPPRLGRSQEVLVPAPGKDQHCRGASDTGRISDELYDLIGILCDGLQWPGFGAGKLGHVRRDRHLVYVKFIYEKYRALVMIRWNVMSQRP